MKKVAETEALMEKISVEKRTVVEPKAAIVKSEEANATLRLLDIATPRWP